MTDWNEIYKGLEAIFQARCSFPKISGLEAEQSYKLLLKRVAIAEFLQAIDKEWESVESIYLELSEIYGE